MAGRLQGRVALVTGSSRGIGRGCVLAFADEGADVVINDLANMELAHDTAREVERMGRRALVHQADVTDRAAVRSMVDATVAHYGRLDILVANAYRSVRQPFLEITPEAFAATLDVTLFGTFSCCQAAARVMAARGRGGKIIIISSIHAEQPFALSTAYNTAKAGITHMAGTMANELAGHHINVNVIAPGWIDTPGERQYATEEEMREGSKSIPWGRLGTPRDIGKAAAFLASDDADFVTGAFLRVDGGQMCRLGSG